MRYFKTKAAAERFLEVRRKAAYKRIEKKGWKIVGDTSFAMAVNKWEKCEIDLAEEFGISFTGQKMPGMRMTDKIMWQAILMITTDEMIKDLTAMMSIDYEEELSRALEEEIKTDDDDQKGM
jgi:hypothetical protein